MPAVGDGGASAGRGKGVRAARGAAARLRGAERAGVGSTVTQREPRAAAARDRNARHYAAAARGGAAGVLGRPYEQQIKDYTIIAGTPETVIPKIPEINDSYKTVTDVL